MAVRFSVLMPVYNREKYVGRAVESVLSQTYQNFELIAVDDGSTDRSVDILRSYGSRIKVLQQANQGPEVARNAGAAIATGKYIVFLDSDDFFFPFAFETFDYVIEKFESPPVLLGSMIFFEDGQESSMVLPKAHPVEVSVYRDYLSKTQQLGTNCIVVRRSAFEEVGGMRDSTPQTFHGDDTNFLLKVGTHGPCVVINQPATSGYRQHVENSTKDTKAIADALLRLAETERQGGYGGGKERRLERYAYIGGRSASWAYMRCWRGGQRILALKLLSGTAPMVAVAIWNKILRKFRDIPGPTVVTE